jgi:hypothetical protein
MKAVPPPACMVDPSGRRSPYTAAAEERPYPPSRGQAAGQRNGTKAMCARIYNSLANFEAVRLYTPFPPSIIGQIDREE